ncbi:MAG: hypothetical protein COT71_03410 [Candidatus Andersenbacteria bacterium CG10_big_fil_rev_8_21_14_0_10_54_11]|uniref:Adenylate kinase n=1 Tax=Candidatus Andersenbacteria bacterium CG10_big_fil_rev_8_21_14_0_10_54_11 TaxID=1974485 RepID=A0A2M6WYU1_9BACT|nr:MAG: hypothetical protein COT71_03410 [Candidatus Andersenbacteria bacterium CG10_big_fil_rev_8_21_14_0_10_54_11]
MALPKVIYIMGPPGAGKGTQAELLAKAIGYHRFSTGDAFRAVSRQDTPLGRRVKETIDNGFLAPPEMAAEIVITAVRKQAAAGRGLIFDGTPRTVEEAVLVDQFFAQYGFGNPLVIYLQLDREEMVRRNSQRQFCLGVAGDFPVLTEDDARRCAAAGGTVGTRPDDEPEKFATRWNEFMNWTYPVVEKYRQRGILYTVNGMGTIEEVQRAVADIVSAEQHTADGSP